MSNWEVLSGAPNGKTAVSSDGTTYYQWSFTVEVDGQVGIVNAWSPTNDPAAASDLEQWLDNNLGDYLDTFGGIAVGDPQDDSPDDDDDDGAFASADGSDYGDSA